MAGHFALVVAQVPASYTVSTVAGTNWVGDGGRAVAAQLASAEGLAVDPAGNLYIADSADHRIRKVSTNGLISTLAGNGNPGFSGDGGQAAEATLHTPYGVAVDPSGNVYIADYGNARVRRIGTDGIIRTVAGGGQRRAPGDGGDALGARFSGPRNLALDVTGNLYISDYTDHRVYRVSPGGQIAVVAGSGAPGYNGDGVGVSVQLNAPAGLAVDRNGALWIADSGNKLVRRLAGGTLTTVVGGMTQTIPLITPAGVAVDANGALYIADRGQGRVFQRSPSGLFTTLAGVDGVRDVTLDSLGGVCVSSGRIVVKLPFSGPPVPVAGDGTFAPLLENADATLCYLRGPIGIALDEMGNFYIAEEGLRRVRRVTMQGVIQTVAGGGSGNSPGDGGLATSAVLLDPVAVATDGLGALRIADYQGNRVRGVLLSGTIFTAAGDGDPGYRGDTLPASTSRLNRPRGLAYDREGNLYIADSLNHRVRRIGTNGIITTAAGSGVRGYFGDGGLATQAHLNTPLGVALDNLGNLYIADSANHAIRKVTLPAGVISTVAGSGAQGFSGDGGPAILAAFYSPSAVAVDAAGNLFVADTFNHRLRCITGDGMVKTIAGTGTPGFSGDGGAATSAQFRSPSSVVVDSRGNLWVADLDNNRVRKLTPSTAPPPAQQQLAEAIVMNAASFRSGPIAPGEQLLVLGDGIGGEAEVRFDGQPAPSLDAGPDQVNVQAPYAIASREETEIEILLRGKAQARVRVPVAAAAPGVYTTQRGVGQAVMNNPDGSLNSATNPAPRGSLVAFYATGEGAAGLPVEVRVGTSNADVQWVGSVPGSVGVMQVNVKLPGVFTPPGIRSLTLFVGGVASQPGVTIAVE